MRRYVLVSVLLLFILNSCNGTHDKATSGTYIGGQIVNPVSNSIILRKDNRNIIDLPLSQNNRFFYKIKDFKPGLYSFFHNERQLVYLEEGDSIMLRVNTIEFDESLTFTGYGAAQNNFMLSLYLLNEKENESMMTVYQQDPLLFQQTLDSLRDVRTEDWENFKAKHEVSEGFEGVINAIIDYDYYARKEVYPLSRFGSDKYAFLQSLPDDFYDYRDDVDFNRENLLSLYSYQRFLMNYFNQAAFKQYAGTEDYNSQSFTHNLHKLRLIDSTVSNDSIKSYLLTRTIKEYLANSNDKKGGEEIFDLYMKHIPSNFNKKEIEKLYTSNQNVEAGKKMPDEILINMKGEKVHLDKLITKPTFIFLWSKDKKNHSRQAHLMAQELINKFPEYAYIAININIDTQEWLRITKLNGFNPKNEFKINDNFEEIKDELSINSIFKTFIVDKNGTIQNAHANMFSTDFENELLGYLNK